MLYWVVIVCTLTVTISACSFFEGIFGGGGKEVFVALGDVDNQLKAFEGNDTLDFVKGQYSYDATGIGQIDEVFKDITLLRASLNQTIQGLDAIKQLGLMTEVSSVLGDSWSKVSGAFSNLSPTNLSQSLEAIKGLKSTSMM